LANIEIEYTERKTMEDSTESGKVNRIGFLRKATGWLVTFGLGVVGGLAAFGSRRRNTVWQIDPSKCTKCEHCSTDCVVSPSAVKCVQSYDICGYCRYCFGYFHPNYAGLTSAAENQLCPTDAIERVFVEDPYWEYNIEHDKCIGCAKCVKACEDFGNASFYLQVNHDVCVNCNNCSIAMQCPSDAWERVPISEAYKLKHEQGQLMELDLKPPSKMA
tara:strand:- start:223 stop:873 length:651 start_codon:yes stop_codon:yes gene_type:complete